MHNDPKYRTNAPDVLKRGTKVLYRVTGDLLREGHVLFHQDLRPHGGTLWYRVSIHRPGRKGDGVTASADQIKEAK